MTKIRAGVAGTGFMGMAQVEGIRRSGMAEIVAIAGPSKEEAEKKAKELGIESVYADCMELAKDPDIEILHNCTPNNLHFPINRIALTEGKHVISEKPLAMDSREGRLLLGAAERSGMVSAIMFNYRNYPMVARFRELVQGGDLGEIYAVRGSYLQDWLLYDADYSWRVEAALGGATRTVTDLGSHWLDLAQTITGLKITQVMADLQTVVPVRKKSVTTVGTFGRSITPRDVDIQVENEDWGTVLLQFEDNVKGSLTISQVSAGRKNQFSIQIDGSKKSVAWDQEQPDVLWYGYRDRKNEFEPKKAKATKVDSYAHYPAGYGEAWANSVKDFMCSVYQYIADGKKPGRDPAEFATFADGMESSTLIDKILNSSRQRRWVKTDL